MYWGWSTQSLAGMCVHPVRRHLTLTSTYWPAYLLEGLIEVALLQQLQDMGLLGLAIEVGSGDGCASS